MTDARGIPFLFGRDCPFFVQILWPITASLEDNLANGQHVLLVVASGLMDGLSRDLLQYLNLRMDVPIYGVEIDVFETQTQQIIVPRGVRYTPRTRRSSTSTRGKTDRPTFLAACTPVAATFFTRLLEEAEEKGMIINWGRVGFSVRMPLDNPVTVMYGYPPNDFQVFTAQLSLSSEGRVAFHSRLREVAPFELGGEYTNHIYLDQHSEEHTYTALAFMWDEIERMMASHRQES